MMRLELTTSGSKALALPLSYTRLHPPFPHRGIRVVNDQAHQGGTHEPHPLTMRSATNSVCVLYKLDVMRKWHAMTDSNRRPPRSKRGALSAELMACGNGGPCRNRTCIGRSKSPLPRHSAKDPLW
jgi:hypothetical protein